MDLKEVISKLKQNYPDLKIQSSSKKQHSMSSLNLFDERPTSARYKREKRKKKKKADKKITRHNSTAIIKKEVSFSVVDDVTGFDS